MYTKKPRPKAAYTRKHTVLPVSIRLKSTEKTPACVSMRAFLQPISAQICFGKTASRLLRRMFSYARRPNGRSFFVYGMAGRCGISPYGRFAAPLCRAGPACPAGINAYCAAGHMGPALRIILRPLRCRASLTGGRRGGRLCPPRVTAHFLPGRCGHRPLRIHPPVMRCRGRRPRRPAQREALSFRAGANTGVGIRFLCPTARLLTR